ncbi:MAG: phage virion morphogenesis protein [Bacteroidales bacterium]
MANTKKLEDFIANLKQRQKAIIPELVAETATAFFKERFSLKQDPDGHAWLPTKKTVKKGSLMVRSGALVNSIRPTVIDAKRVRISAGNRKVPYARVHNEGGTIKRDKRFNWADADKAKKAENTEYIITIPPRTYMKHSQRLNIRILKRIIDNLNT